MSRLLLSSVITVNSPQPGDDFVSETLRIIDTVHTIDGLGCPPDTEIVWRDGNGETKPWGEFTPGGSMIFLDPDYELKCFTLLHEIGHFIDWYLGDGRQFASAGRDEYRDWMKAIQLSDWCTRLSQIWPKFSASQKKRLESACLPTVELWARSYQQFVALESGATTLIEPLSEYLSQDPNTFEVWYWDWADFQPIRDSVRQLLHRHGWL